MTAIAIERLAELADLLGQRTLGEEARALSERAADGRFYVACIGQFKRGKSTLIDALVGAPLLPVGVLPVTSVPTVVRFGEAGVARAQIGGVWRDVGIESLAQYVSEEFNPENAKAVAGVEVCAPSDVLRHGLCLVDTPGIGSVFGSNTAVTRAFIPHIDAAIVVLGCDPPITGEELDLVAAVGSQVRDLIVVLNKADRAARGDLAVTKQFTERTLSARLGRPIGPVLEVSAAERLEALAPERDWPRLLDRLGELARESGGALAAGALSRGRERIERRLRELVAAERRALTEPLHAYEARIAALSARLDEADHALADLGYQLMGEEQRLASRFAAMRDTFYRAEKAAALEELAARSRDLRTRGRRLRRDLAAAAQAIAAARVRPWLAAQQARANEIYTDAMGRFVTMARGFLGRVAEAAPEAGVVPDDVDLPREIRARSTFHFHLLDRLAADASPFRFVADVARGALGARRGIARETAALLDELLFINSARVEGDLNEQVRVSRARLESDVRRVLSGARAEVAASMERVRAAHAAGGAAVQDALNRLEALARELAEVSPSAPPPAP